MGNLFSEETTCDTPHNGGDSLLSLSLNSPEMINLSFLQDTDVMNGGNAVSNIDKYNVFKMLHELEQNNIDKKIMNGGKCDESKTLSHTELLNKLKNAVNAQEGGNNEMKTNFKQYLEQELNKIQDGGAQSCEQCGAMEGGCGCNKVGGMKSSSTSTSSSGITSSSSLSSSSTFTSSSSSSFEKNKKKNETDKKHKKHKKHKKNYYVINNTDTTNGGNATSESYVNTSNMSDSNDERGLNIFPFNSATNSEYSSYSQKMLRRHL